MSGDLNQGLPSLQKPGGGGKKNEDKKEEGRRLTLSQSPFQPMAFDAMLQGIVQAKSSSELSAAQQAMYDALVGAGGVDALSTQFLAELWGEKRLDKVQVLIEALSGAAQALEKAEGQLALWPNEPELVASQNDWLRRTGVWLRQKYVMLTEWLFEATKTLMLRNEVLEEAYVASQREDQDMNESENNSSDDSKGKVAKKVYKGVETIQSQLQTLIGKVDNIPLVAKKGQPQPARRRNEEERKDGGEKAPLYFNVYLRHKDFALKNDINIARWIKDELGIETLDEQQKPKFKVEHKDSYVRVDLEIQDADERRQLRKKIKEALKKFSDKTLCSLERNIYVKEAQKEAKKTSQAQSQKQTKGPKPKKAQGNN